MDMLEALQRELNFSVSYFNPDPVFDYGSLDNEAGKWTGGMRMIHEKNVDFVLDYAMDFEKFQARFCCPFLGRF